MMIAGRPAKILLIDSNVYFAKRISDALKTGRLRGGGRNSGFLCVDHPGI